MKEVANKCCGWGWKSRGKTREQCQWIQIEPSKHLVISCWYMYLIDWVSGQYGETLHECAEVFSRAEGEGKYCTRVQCLAILTTNPVNERFIIHFFDQWCLTDQPAHFRAF